LIPADVKELHDKFGITAIVQPSSIRIFPDEEYEMAKAPINESLRDADVVFAVKEIPVALLEKGKTYVFFSHTVKGQPYNMKMLKRLMELQCNLIDYERMSDHRNARIISFSLYAGMAGMIETLHAFGRKMKLQGHSTPFERIKQAYQYGSEMEAKEEIRDIGLQISKTGISNAVHPLTIGLTGYGNVSKGAQNILDFLPVQTITPDQLRKGIDRTELDNCCIYKIVFEEKDMVKPHHGNFELQDYYDHPQKYRSVFDDFLPGLKILVNCVYWTEQYPRLISCDNLKRHFAGATGPGLQVIGDISCDIHGSIEITKAATKPDNACYTYYADKNTFIDGIHDTGITVMAIDNLPCEFPREASAAFSLELKAFVNDIASADFQDRLR
jgi:saccharopine dehydrogenase (NAD+, L-lysine-forming)